LYDSYAFTPALRDGDPFLFLRTGAEAPAYFSKRLSEALWSLANFQAAFSNLTGEDARPEMRPLRGLYRRSWGMSLCEQALVTHFAPASS